eukprot:tig00021127_g18797.t1
MHRRRATFVPGNAPRVVRGPWSGAAPLGFQLPASGTEPELEILSKKAPGHAEGGILLIHGAFHGAWCYEAWLEYMAQRGFDVVALSRRGHGGSGPHPGEGAPTLEDYASDVRRALVELERLSDRRRLKRWAVTLVGHSAGALVAQHVARTGPAPSGLVLLSPPAMSPWPYLAALLAAPLRFFGIVRSFVTRSFLTDPEACRRLFFTDDTPLLVVAGHMGRLKDPGRGKDIRRSPGDVDLTRPPAQPFPRVLVVTGEHDPIVTPGMARATAGVYGAEVAVVPGAGHDVMLPDGGPERWRAAADLVLDFARRGAQHLL